MHPRSGNYTPRKPQACHISEHLLPEIKDKLLFFTHPTTKIDRVKGLSGSFTVGTTVLVQCKLTYFLGHVTLTMSGGRSIKDR